MKQPKQKRYGKPSADSLRKRPYSQARDEFLKRAPTKSNRAYLLLATEIGSYVYERWIAEDQASIAAGRALTPAEIEEIWDDCTNQYFHQISRNMQDLLTEQLDNRVFGTSMRVLRTKFAGLRVLWWLLKEAGGAIVGAIAIVIFAILASIVAPNVVAKAGEELGQLLLDGAHPAASGQVDANIAAPEKPLNSQPEMDNTVPVPE